MDKKRYIKHTLGERVLWEQLGEESAELTQAALKYIRAAGLNNNPTPITQDEALANVKEELQDVLCVCELLGLIDNVEMNEKKLERWVNRIGDMK